VSTNTGDWSDTTALTALPKGYPVKDDIVTIFKTDDPKVANTKMWNGVNGWVAPALAVHGDMVVDGTIRADKLVVNEIFSKDITYTGTITGGNVAGGGIIKSYDGNMVIDLRNGRIDIKDAGGNLRVRLGKL
jgi:hypothetical protein